MINFCSTDKIRGVPLSKKLMDNIMHIMKNTHCIHHSHVSGEISGYAHSFCNEKVRKNYYRIPVIAHNLFRYNFIFFTQWLTS